MNLPQWIQAVKERVDRNEMAIECLIQPEKSFIRDTADLKLAVEVIEVLIESLKFECGNRCAEQNPCNAKVSIRMIDALLKGSGE